MKHTTCKKLIAVCVIALFAIFPAMGAMRADSAAYPPIKGGPGGLVLSSHRLADEIGQKILDGGGNAVDAAVPVAELTSKEYAGQIYEKINASEGTTPSLVMLQSVEVFAAKAFG